MKRLSPKIKEKTITINNHTEVVLQDAFCGKCGGVLYGYDEYVCPSCGCFVDWRNPIKIDS